MTRADKLFQEFEEEWAYWKRALNNYTEEQLQQLTDASGWTMGQVYDHLIMTSYDLSRDWIPECLATYEETGHLTKTAIGTATFLLGKFPPIRAKFAGPDPTQPQNKADIETRFDELFNAVRDTRDLLNQATQSGKKKHFAFGYLDGRKIFYGNVLRLFSFYQAVIGSSSISMPSKINVLSVGWRSAKLTR